MLLAGGLLTIDKGKTHRIVDLHAYPQVQPYIESIRATLAGDRAGLEKLFTLEFTGDLARWTLTLLPKDPEGQAHGRTGAYRWRKGSIVEGGDSPTGR